MTRRPSFEHLEAAYQLHFCLCFKTHYLRPVFGSNEMQTALQAAVDDVCNRHGYHLLDIQTSPDHVRLLVSLKPDQTISRAVQMIKGNLSRQLSRDHAEILVQHRTQTPWAEGYFARSSGKADLSTIRRYVEHQPDHHGYRGEWTSALTHINPLFRSPAYTFDHCVCILGYHLVLVTKSRTPVFDDDIAPRLFEYVIAIGNKRGFAVESLGVALDHVHLLIEARPDVSIADCALSLANNTRQWMEKHYWGALKQTGCWDVWQPSFYAGTVGEFSTAQIRRFMGQS